MSSALLSALTSLQQNNYVTRMSIFTFEEIDITILSVSILTTVGYDYGEL